MANRTIRSLQKTGSKKRNVIRDKFSQELKKVRKRDQRSVKREQYTWHKKGGKDQRNTPYRFKGDTYRARRFFSHGVLKTRIPNHVIETVKRKGKARILDIGSAQGRYWKPFMNKLGETASKVELHTLNPSNYFRKTIPTKEQHVGAVETKALAKLGKFDAITAFYSIGQAQADFGQVLNKLSRRLSKNGKLFVIFGMRVQKKTLTDTFGKDFKIDFMRINLKGNKKTFNNALIVTKTN